MPSQAQGTNSAESDKGAVEVPDGKIVMPGDMIQNLADLSSSGTVQVGVGLTLSDENVVANKAGVLRVMGQSGGGIRTWVESNSKRYIPCVEDMVIGVVTDKHADEYRLDIRSSRSLLLPDCTVINSLGLHIPFEMAVGANGRVWVKSGSVSSTILLVNAILNAEYLTPPQVETLVAKLVQHMLQ